MLPTASSLGRALKCTASAVLPRVKTESSEAAERGTAIHQYLAAIMSGAAESAALTLVPEQYRDACEVIDLGRLPVAASMRGEVALAYHVATETTREISDHEPVTGGEISMHVDVLGHTPDRVVALDYKTGRGHVETAGRNAQVMVAALAASRLWGIASATVGIVRVLDDVVSYDLADLDDMELALFAERLRELAATVTTAQRAYADTGAVPAMSTGEHCRYCPSRLHCPAQMAIIRQLAVAPDLVTRDVRDALTPELAGEAYRRLQLAKRAVGDAEAALRAYAAETPIQLEGGRVFGPREVRREQIDGAVAARVLAGLWHEHGLEPVWAACSIEATKASVGRGAKVASNGRPVTAVTREALEAIRAAGGVTETVSTRTEEYAP